MSVDFPASTCPTTTMFNNGFTPALSFENSLAASGRSLARLRNANLQNTTRSLSENLKYAFGVVAAGTSFSEILTSIFSTCCLVSSTLAPVKKKASVCIFTDNYTLVPSYLVFLWSPEAKNRLPLSSGRPLLPETPSPL